MNNKIEIIQYKTGASRYSRKDCLVPILNNTTTYGMFLQVNRPRKIEKVYDRKQLNKIVSVLKVYFPKAYKAKAIFRLYE